MEKKHKTASELEDELNKLKAEFAHYKQYTDRERENPGVTIVLTVLLLAIGGLMAAALQYGWVL